MAPSADPNIPPPNGKCLLLDLPVELRCEIWRLALTPAPRALTYRDYIYMGPPTSELCSVQVDDTFQTTNYTDPFQVKYLCKQIRMESISLPLSLHTIMVVSNSKTDRSFATEHLDRFLLGSRAKSLWQDIQVVTIRCERMKQQMHNFRSGDPETDDTIFVDSPTIFIRHIHASTLAFLQQHPQATIRICLPELAREEPMHKRILVACWILTIVRGNRVPDPFPGGILPEPHKVTLHPQFFQSPSGVLPPRNMRFIPPVGEVVSKEELDSWLEDLPQDTVDFCANAAEGWRKDGL
ncbi:hypothetical protein SLS60_009274 [Paraconiothyrium brasiliense]|uniref:Uncharacterized protein n=1 Tax=Paraconiothyrium brasiliense TaxID=300254 RepID=A0ABR3QWT9_9PLEO